MSVDQADVIEVFASKYPVVELLSPRLPDAAAVIQVFTRGPAGPPGPQGDQGVQGEVGEQGTQGPPGAEFEQTFAAPSTHWVVVHNLDAYPVATTFDLYGNEIVGAVTYPDRNTVVIDWLVPFAGVARLKA